jgi:1-acyl-sn-glycerol-3-phosphate acyltransferase
MFKYFIWVFKAGIPIVWNYFTWMRRYAKHPERYSREERFARAQKFTRKVLKRLKVDVEIRNMPVLSKEKVYYFVGNHTSLMDALVTLAYMPLPVHYVSKVENEKIPFVGTMFKVVGGVLIERDNLKQEIKAMQTTRESLGKGETSWILFPEGTRNKDYHAPLLEYKAGAFKAPLQTNTEIVPFVLWGNQLILPKKTRAKRYKVIMEYLPPVDPSGTTQEIASNIQSASQEVANRLKEEYFQTQKLNKYGRLMIDPALITKKED